MRYTFISYVGPTGQINGSWYRSRSESSGSVRGVCGGAGTFVVGVLTDFTDLLSQGVLSRILSSPVRVEDGGRLRSTLFVL